MTDVGRDAALRALVAKWRERARLNAMPPRPSDASPDIADPARWAWKNVGIAQQQCADELSALLASPDPVVGAVPDQKYVDQLTALAAEMRAFKDYGWADALDRVLQQRPSSPLGQGEEDDKVKKTTTF